MYVERLDAVHDLTSFRCGVEALDVWLRVHALENQRRNLSRSFVLVDGGQVIGYCSLTMGGLSRDELPRRIARGLPDTFEIGMVLLARLAISVDRQGLGLGRDLLIDAIARAAAAGEHAAARFIAVDPTDEMARSFYTAFGFGTSPETARKGRAGACSYASMRRSPHSASQAVPEHPPSRAHRAGARVRPRPAQCRERSDLRIRATQVRRNPSDPRSRR